MCGQGRAARLNHADAGLSGAASDTVALRASATSAALKIDGQNYQKFDVVARDGIEPPTPAFRRAAGEMTALRASATSAALKIDGKFEKSNGGQGRD